MFIYEFGKQRNTQKLKKNNRKLETLRIKKLMVIPLNKKKKKAKQISTHHTCRENCLYLQKAKKNENGRKKMYYRFQKHCGNIKQHMFYCSMEIMNNTIDENIL